MKSLDEIAISNGTDKATVFTRTYAKPKGYTIHYERFFAPLRDKPVKLVEIGVGGGESIRTWLEYFFSGERFIGIDNVAGTNLYNVPKRPEEVSNRYQFVHGDQTDETFWKCFAADYGKDWDIIIDDGGHFNDTTIISFNGLWPLLKNGGLYCIEDLGTAYGDSTIFVKGGFPNHMDWLKTMIDWVNQGTTDGVDSIYFSKELCIIRKT